MLECLNFSSEEIIDYGMSPFFALSVQHFEVLAIDLGFTAPHHKDLRAIGREFSEAPLYTYGLWIPKKTIEKLSSDEALITRWQNAFNQLETIGYAEIINNWIAKSKFEKSMLRRFDSRSWHDFLVDWAKNSSNFPPLNLSQYLISEIRQRVMLQRILELEMRYSFPRAIEDVETDDWEEHLLKRESLESWLKNRIHLQQQVTKWVGILRLMTKRQIKMMDKWAYNVIKNDNEYFPLNEFAEVLQEKGYF